MKHGVRISAQHLVSHLKGTVTLAKDVRSRTNGRAHVVLSSLVSRLRKEQVALNELLAEEDEQAEFRAIRRNADEVIRG